MASQNFSFNPSRKNSDVPGGHGVCMGCTWGQPDLKQKLLLGFQVVRPAWGHRSVSEPFVFICTIRRGEWRPLKVAWLRWDPVFAGTVGMLIGLRLQSWPESWKRDPSFPVNLLPGPSGEWAGISTTYVLRGPSPVFFGYSLIRSMFFQHLLLSGQVLIAAVPWHVTPKTPTLVALTFSGTCGKQ